MSRSYVTLVCGLSLLIAAATLISARDDRVWREGETSVYNKAKPIKSLIPNKFDDLPKDWLTLPVMTENRMFSPLFLPFVYHADGVPADPIQSLTFPSLLGYKFDFVPDNLLPPSPLLAFQTNPSIEKMNWQDPKVFSQWINDWGCTHAIGGELVAHAAGYTATLVVYDDTGNEILRKVYPTPLPYFTLMGKIVEDWMAFRNQTCSPALKAELERPLTSNFDTVRWLGQVFRVKQKSAAEWAIYDKILKVDPSFAEIRYYYANRKGGPVQYLQSEEAKAILIHPVIRAIWLIKIDQIQDQSLRKKAALVIAQAHQSFPEHNLFIAQRAQECLKQNSSMTVTNQLLPWALRYSQQCWLLQPFSNYYLVRAQVDKSTPLALAAAASPQANKVSSTAIYLYWSAAGYWYSGHIPGALSLLSASIKANDYAAKGFQASESQRAIPIVLRDLLQFENAVKYSMDTYKKTKDPSALVDAYLAAYELGDTKLLLELEKAITTLGEKDAKLCRGRKLASEGKFEECQRLFPMSSGDIWLNFSARDYDLESACIVADAALMSNNTDNREIYVKKAWQFSPCIPRTAHLLKLLLLKHAPEDLARYAEVMAWKAPEVDYWKSFIVEARRAGAEEDTQADARAILQELKTKYTGRNPEAIAGELVMASPFINEYLIVKAIEWNDSEMKNDAMDIYVKSIESTKNFPLPPKYRAHQASFFAKAITAYPKDDQEKWLERMMKACDIN
ncbi:MAG: hypothetical protein ACYDBB_21310 [Armatimonadota bacterium]